MGELLSAQLERALTIRDMLCGETWTTRPQIAAELGVDVKTVGRYIGALKRMGYSIVAARGKGLRLDGELSEGQLILTDEELFALFLSLAKSADKFPHRVVANLRRRLINQLSRSARKKVERIENVSDATGTESDGSILRDIFTSLESGRLLRIRYRGLKDRIHITRTIGPLRFASHRDAWVLEAWDVEKGGERNFRLDRIGSSSLLAEKFVAREKSEPSAQHPWDFGSVATTVSLLLQPRLAEWLRENPVHPSQALCDVGDGVVRCTLQVTGREKFIDWVMGLRGFCLEGPPEFQAALVARAQAMATGCGTFDVPWEIRGEESSVAVSVAR